VTGATPSWHARSALPGRAAVKLRTVCWLLALVAAAEAATTPLPCCDPSCAPRSIHHVAGGQNLLVIELRDGRKAVEGAALST
jgi:hypothetical protein